MCLLQCHGESSVHDAAKPSHPMAGHALNAQLFVAELQFSLLPPFVGQIEASVDPATCTIRLSLIELRIFSASKNRSVPYEDK